YPIGAANYPWTTACSLMTRMRRTGFPAQPNTFIELDSLFRNGSLERFCVNGQNMYRGYVASENGKAHLVFACHTLVELVLRLNPTNMYVDQTFRIVPPNPKLVQLITFHFEIEICNFPTIYCFMEDESPSSYRSLICFIKDMVLPGYCPRNIFSDINLNLISPLGYYYPTAYLDCTWFQHNQNLYEHMIKFGYSNLIMNSGIAFRCLKMLMVLPLLPPNKIEVGFEEVKAYASRMQVHIPRMFDYYNWHWLHLIGSNSISVYLKPTRTINNIEVFHKKFNRTFRNSPTIWTFLSGIYNLNSAYAAEAERLCSGGYPTKSFRCQLLYNHFKIKTHTQRLMTGEIPIKDFILLCSEALNGYEEHLRSWTIKMSINSAFNNAMNGESSDSDVEANYSYDEFGTFDNAVRENLEQFQQQPPPLLPPPPPPPPPPQQQQQQQQQQYEHQQQPHQQQQHESEDIADIIDYEVDSPASSESNDQSSRIFGYCMVCLTTKRERKYLILPCGHSWICQKCRDKDLTTCPYCREDIECFIRVLETTV
ncbi:RING-type domain-containing protein, partial [Aphis craccivora]